MGCSVGKLDDSRKLKNSPILDVSDIPIQTVLQLDKRPSKGSASKKKGPKRKGHRRKSQPPKGSYDPKITAKYEIKAVIGKGTFSRVLRVEHRVSRQPYALKMVSSGPGGGREAFEAELSVLRRLHHPHVIQLMEVFECEQKAYMVMELATGGSLLDRLEARGNLGDEDAREAVRMVLKGVTYLHSLGITHRDLKPDNLLYYHPGADSRLMITDFSFASSRKSSGNPFMATVCGTPQYIAPEVVLRKPYTCAVDLWAVGVIAYIALSGAFPFDAEHDAQLFKLILKGQPSMTHTVWCHVSSEAQSLVRSLLSVDPSLRPPAPQALAHPWFRLPSSSPPQWREGGSLRSGQSSCGSSRGSSGQSLRASGRVRAQQLDALIQSDPEIAAMA